MNSGSPAAMKEQPETIQGEQKLFSILREMKTVLIAFSGGVDSTYLLNACLRALGPAAVSAVVVDHPLLRDGEAAEALDSARRMGAAVYGIALDPGCLKEVSGNSPERCYHCKRFIFSRLSEMAREKGISRLLDGTNADDAEGYRPGTRALEELGVGSPLRGAGLTKDQIRALSREQGLETWNKPPAPCLATRFPYGHRITGEDLDRVRRGESLLRREGFGDLRLRVHGVVARIEVTEEGLELLAERDRRQRLVAALKSLGYRYVTLDLEGLRSGSMDEALSGGRPSLRQNI